jgi:hypothetical protein
MKKTTILALAFSLIFASPSYAKWEKEAEAADGNTFYVDFERIRKHDGFVYFWQLQDLLKPTKHGILSENLYTQADCKLFRYKVLSFVFHKQRMGQDTGERVSPKKPEWNYPPPDTVDETILKSVCSR